MKGAIEDLRNILNADSQKTILDTKQANESIRPLRPDEVAEQQIKQFPDEVVQAFNELIALNTINGSGRVLEKDVIARMEAKGLKRKDIYEKGWLNVREIFKKAGWTVVHDRPVYYGGDNYEPFFSFRSEPKK